MIPALRLIREDGVSDRYGLAGDEVLAARAGEGRSPATLRLYTYRSHAALVGRFQTVEHELHLDYCRSQGIAVNRRPTGGGAIIMGEQQLGVALCIPGQRDATYGNARSLMSRFSAGLVSALQHYGIGAAFTRKNDLEVGGRKIAGLGIHRTKSGGILFHASLLVDLDVPLMLRVLNTPFEKISDKEIRNVSDRITTLNREHGSAVEMDAVREVLADGFRSAWGAEIESGDFSAGELTAIDALIHDRYATTEWLFRQSKVTDADGFARVKSAGGLLGARVATAGKQLKAVYLEGDFFSSSGAIAALEGSLRWHSTAGPEIRSTLEAVYARYAADLASVPIEALQEVILRAIAAAAEDADASDPYGCFVEPGREEVAVAAAVGSHPKSNIQYPQSSGGRQEEVAVAVAVGRKG